MSTNSSIQILTLLFVILIGICQSHKLTISNNYKGNANRFLMKWRVSKQNWSDWNREKKFKEGALSNTVNVQSNKIRLKSQLALYPNGFFDEQKASGNYGVFFGVAAPFPSAVKDITIQWNVFVPQLDEKGHRHGNTNTWDKPMGRGSPRGLGRASDITEYFKNLEDDANITFHCDFTITRVWTKRGRRTLSRTWLYPVVTAVGLGIVGVLVYLLYQPGKVAEAAPPIKQGKRKKEKRIVKNGVVKNAKKPKIPKKSKPKAKRKRNEKPQPQPLARQPKSKSKPQQQQSEQPSNEQASIQQQAPEQHQPQQQPIPEVDVKEDLFSEVSQWQETVEDMSTVKQMVRSETHWREAFEPRIQQKRDDIQQEMRRLVEEKLKLDELESNFHSQMAKTKSTHNCFDWSPRELAIWLSHVEYPTFAGYEDDWIIHLENEDFGGNELRELRETNDYLDFVAVMMPIVEDRALVKVLRKNVSDLLDGRRTDEAADGEPGAEEDGENEGEFTPF